MCWKTLGLSKGTPGGGFPAKRTGGQRFVRHFGCRRSLPLERASPLGCRQCNPLQSVSMNSSTKPLRVRLKFRAFPTFKPACSYHDLFWAAPDSRVGARLNLATSEMGISKQGDTTIGWLSVGRSKPRVPQTLRIQKRTNPFWKTTLERCAPSRVCWSKNRTMANFEQHNQLSPARLQTLHVKEEST